MSQVIYARVPDSVKESADLYASQRGTTLTGAVVDLLQRGLAAASDERSIAELQTNLANVTAEKRQAEADLATARTELAAVNSFAQRATRNVGTCPNPKCGQQITGSDVLGLGQCRNCGQTLTSIFAPPSATSTLDQREVLMLLGALGAVLAMAYFASQ